MGLRINLTRTLLLISPSGRQGRHEPGRHRGTGASRGVWVREAADAGTGPQLPRGQRGLTFPVPQRQIQRGETEQRSAQRASSQRHQHEVPPNHPHDVTCIVGVLHTRTPAEHTYVPHCLKMKTFRCLCSPSQPDLLNLRGPFHEQDPGKGTHRISGDNTTPVPCPKDVLATIRCSV